MGKNLSKPQSLFIVLLVYAVAFYAACLIYTVFAGQGSLVAIFAADVAATIVVFAFSIVFSNSSMYDPYWSVAPPVIAVFLANQFPEGNSIRQILIIALISFWSLRLTINWIRGWEGMKHQDWRYTSIASKTGKFYWPVSFLGIHLMPTLFVFAGCLPLWYSLKSAAPLNFADILIVQFTLIAIFTEFIADEQLIRYRKVKQAGTFIETGLWKYSRHPNYLGEISFWGGMFLFVISSSEVSGTQGLWTVVGFVGMVLLFILISIPLMEKRNLERKPGYAEYVKRVPALIPWRIKTK